MKVCNDHGKCKNALCSLVSCQDILNSTQHLRGTWHTLHGLLRAQAATASGLKKTVISYRAQCTGPVNNVSTTHFQVVLWVSVLWVAHNTLFVPACGDLWRTLTVQIYVFEGYRYLGLNGICTIFKECLIYFSDSRQPTFSNGALSVRNGSASRYKKKDFTTWRHLTLAWET